MTKTIIKIAMALSLVNTITAVAQSTATFDTFTLSPNSYYQDNASTSFVSSGITFRYGWNASFGGYWESGAAYTNMNDTVHGDYTNLYGSITGTALSGSNYATVQNGSVVTFSNTNTGLAGFYITNTTYAWKTIKIGNMFSRKFGDTTGTGSGTSIPQGEYPDWFKVVVRGYRSGAMITDSVEYYLADYRAAGTSSDYTIKNWQFVNCASLGQVDSVMFELKSSDTGAFGMNTPGFFSIDDLTTNYSVGVTELVNISNVSLFPNPSNSNVSVKYNSKAETELEVNVYDVAGKNVIATVTNTRAGENTIHIESASLEAGVYFIELKDAVSSKKIKFVKL
jgi:hypothetical protein